MSSPRERIWATIDCIPHGKVSTYGRIASEVGLGRGARQVGRALRELPPGRDLAWHRVINAAGQISHRQPESAAEQRRRLEAEGVEFSASGRVDLARFGWPPCG